MAESSDPAPESQPATSPSLPPDPDAYDSERAAHARARGLAAPYIPGGEDPDMAATRRRERRYMRWLIGMVVVVVLAGFVLGIAAKLIEDAFGGGGANSTPTAVPLALATQEPPPTPPATPEPSAGPVLGALEDGVPASLDGVAVVHGMDVLSAGKTSADATPFLIGGWFHGVADARFCTFFHPPRPVDVCGFGFDLFVASNTKLGTELAEGAVGKGAFKLAATTIRPVVLRVHTHDPLCVGEFTYCRSYVVLDEIAWLGATLAALPPAPVETPPATSFSRREALAKARRHLTSAYELRSIHVVRDTTAEGIPIGPVSEDPWVWWLKYRIPGTGGSAVFVFDYETGKELLRAYGTQR